MYLYVQSAVAAAVAAVCCYTAVTVVAAPAAAVRHRVPCSKMCCWFIESGSIQCFLSLQTRYIFNTCTPPSSTVAFTASICLPYILGNYGLARSRGRRQPRGEAPVVVIIVLCTCPPKKGDVWKIYTYSHDLLVDHLTT